MERLRAAIEFSKRNRDPLALIMIDIDYFKLINDNYGHNCGDFILVEFSKLCLSIFRNYDVVSRYGGEEFFIILPGTSNTVACDIAERLRIAVEKREFEFGPENPLNITVSLGVTSVDEGGDLRSMIALADEALYISKNAGRNQSSYKILS